ncbi:PTS sugar transporter subunit IIA [Olsenella profusa]|uniref:Phosphoenolpyruvate-dependent sugar PTS family porter, EIIA 2 component n=1 Tax=Olsenella profusa F0195 TaxID=1125712 RepID=U2TTT5_9ACTN|nr:PTS sugar transporter subunit IIA [Olsenella profusa]ERL09493.1 phosphoenolpyruvate-dependent sugar PTS family porter, EIIA 2 component [Olsenella profusa F0195]
MSDMAFGPELILLLDGVKDYQMAESDLANRLVKLGYAKDSYPQAIAEREIVYPTGLDVGGINAAMPHCDISNVNRAAICVGVLKNPVEWRRMDDQDATCKVSFVIMLALKEAHAHLDMLQKVVALIQDQGLMTKIVAAANTNEVYQLVGERLA